MRQLTSAVQVVTVSWVLLLHPIHLDPDVPEGACTRYGCGHVPLEYDGHGGESGCDMVQVPALVDVRHVHGYLPPLDHSVALMVVDDPSQIQFITVCAVGCLPEMEEQAGWRCVPFNLEVVDE